MIMNMWHLVFRARVSPLNLIFSCFIHLPENLLFFFYTVEYTPLYIAATFLFRFHSFEQEDAVFS